MNVRVTDPAVRDVQRHVAGTKRPALEVERNYGAIAL